MFGCRGCIYCRRVYRVLGYVRGVEVWWGLLMIVVVLVVLVLVGVVVVVAIAWSFGA